MLKEEYYEVDYTDDDILYYIDDEQGNEIGFAVMEDGEEVEYYYADSLGDKAAHAVGSAVDGVIGGVKDAIDDNPFVSREQVSGLKGDLNKLYKENKDTVKELRSFGEDLRDLKDLFTGRPLKPRDAAPATAAVAAPVAVAEAVEVEKPKKKKKKDKGKKKDKKKSADAVEKAPESEAAAVPEPESKPGPEIEA